MLSDKITSLQRKPDADGHSILVYLSSQRPFGQSFEEINAICASMPNIRFHLFGKNIPPLNATNVQSYEHGDACFHDILSRCNGIISTAGHTLLSEAMYIGIPVYAIPLTLYEQEMNAHVIASNNFGVSHKTLDVDAISAFIKNIPQYETTIKKDQTVLHRQAGQKKIINFISKLI